MTTTHSLTCRGLLSKTARLGLAVLAAVVMATVLSQPGLAAAANPAYAATYAGETLPDGTQITVGTAATKVFYFTNTGTAPTRGVTLVRTGGNNIGPASVSVTSANKGQRFEARIPFNAPTTLGSYTVYYRLSGPQGFYGPTVWMKIQIIRQPIDLPTKLRNAADYARSQIGKGGWISGGITLCEAFVESAFGTRYQYASAIAAFRALGQAGSPTKAGQLVFFQANATNGNYGHAGIYLSGDRFASVVNGGVVADRSVSSWSQNVAKLVGWANPPDSWPGR